MEEYDKLLLDRNSSTYKRRLAVKIITLLLFIGLMVLAIYKLYPYSGMLKTSEGREYLKGIVAENKVKGAVIFVVLQALQVIIGVIPPLQILGGVLFGMIPGMLLSVLGIFLGSAIVFFLVKIIGYPIVQMMFSDKKVSRFRFLKDEKKIVTVLAIMYLIPGFPKDLLTYLVPLTKISKRDFFLILMPVRIPAIIMGSVVGGSIRGGHYVVAIVFSVLITVLSGVGIIFRDRLIDRFHRLKETKKEKYF